MASITVHGGDFKKSGSYMLGTLFLVPASAPFATQPEPIPASAIVDIDIATEESFRRIGGALGWGVLGAAVVGPAGLLAGLLLGGGKRKEITFLASFRDGRKMIATTDGKTYAKLAGAALTASRPAAPRPQVEDLNARLTREQRKGDGMDGLIVRVGRTSD